MCKSIGKSAACYIENDSDSRATVGDQVARHGCVELLSPDLRELCHRTAPATDQADQQHRPGAHQVPATNHSQHLHLLQQHRVMCCYEDMCNYVKIDVNANVQPRINDTHSGKQRKCSVIEKSRAELNRNLIEIIGFCTMIYVAKEPFAAVQRLLISRYVNIIISHLVILTRQFTFTAVRCHEK